MESWSWHIVSHSEVVVKSTLSECLQVASGSGESSLQTRERCKRAIVKINISSFPYTTHTLTTHTPHRNPKSSPPNARRLVPQSSDRPPPGSTEAWHRTESKVWREARQSLGSASHSWAHQTAIINDDHISPFQSEHSLVFAVRIGPTIRPYRPSASAKIRISTTH